MKKRGRKPYDQKRDSSWEDRYAGYVDHPRYGRKPRFTGLKIEGYHHFRSDGIRGTAVAADLGRQTPATIPVTHYLDSERVCLDCKRPFLFFAEEQKHWYEDLGFGLDSGCVRCVPCRKKEQGIARKRERYEELFHVASRTVEHTLEMAECCLTMIEAKVFHPGQTQRVRMLLNQVPEQHRSQPEFQSLALRLKSAEKPLSTVEHQEP